MPFRCRESVSPSTGGATARAIPGGWQEIVDGAGHNPWFERPGCVAAGLRRLIDSA
jgi:pimeloyl-ACP methyl ester carboxylesterase